MTLAAGGSATDALKATAFAFASQMVWTEVGFHVRDAGIASNIVAKSAVHGVVGGALSMAQGGTFVDGFISNGVGAAAGIVTGDSPLGSVSGGEGVFFRTAIAAAAGGTASALTGGKFANGAVTAAMAHLFNAEDVLAGSAGGAAGGRVVVGTVVLLGEAVEGNPIAAGILIGAGAGYVGWTLFDAVTSVFGNGLIYSDDAPQLPEQLTGDNPRPSGGRTNTDLPSDRFPEVRDKLTGGKLTAGDKPGEFIAGNGVRIRVTGNGPRIDIPAPQSGLRPHETIHFPQGTKW